jgi:hypothetical protein
MRLQYLGERPAWVGQKDVVKPFRVSNLQVFEVPDELGNAILKSSPLVFKEDK